MRPLKLMTLRVHLCQYRIGCRLGLILSFHGILNYIRLLFSVCPSRRNVGGTALLVRLIPAIEIARVIASSVHGDFLSWIDLQCGGCSVRVSPSSLPHALPRSIRSFFHTSVATQLPKFSANVLATITRTGMMFGMKDEHTPLSNVFSIRRVIGRLCLITVLGQTTVATVALGYDT